MLEWLFDYTDFLTRDHCGAWSVFMVYFYQFCNGCVALAYFSIPLSLCWLSERLPVNFKHRPVIVLFMLFIMVCGVHHVCQIFAFHKPAYRLFTALDAILAVVSLATALYLPFVVISVTRQYETPRESKGKP